MTKKKYGVVSSIFIMLGIHLLVSFLVSGMFIFGPAAIFGPMGDIGIIGYEVFCMVILLCFISWRF